MIQLNTFSAANYWVDVVFSPGATLTPPVLGNLAASADYSAGGTATTLSSGTTVSDPESANLVSGTVSIVSGFLTGDTLAATTTGTSHYCELQRRDWRAEPERQ